MSYCFVRITDNYPQFIENFYLQNPSATQLSYNEQYSSLVNSSYETASLYVKNLNKMGINAHGIITNATELQNTWKKENNLPSEISKQKLVIEQLKKYKPDVIWIDDFSIIDSEWKNELLKQVPSIKLFIASICAPYNSIIADKFKLFDVIFSCIPCQQKELLQNGANAHLLYHAFEASALENLNVNN
jgi:spore maturation protein CgeB